METTDTVNANETSLAASAYQDLYSRHPLDPLSSQIRVFTLHPALDRQAPLQGQLRVQDLSSRPTAYEALSYVWGDAEQQHRLYIEDTYLVITDNLHAALQQLRDSSDPRDLWIDAIYINQGNSSEKNHQVRQMHDIYCMASRVSIWLGEGDAESDRIFSRLSGHKPEKRIYDNSYDSDSSLHSDLEELSAIMEKWFGHTDWDTIFSRPWWRRVWMLQEGLAASIHSQSLLLCGNKSMNWLDLGRKRREWLSENFMPRNSCRAPVDDFLDSCARYEEAHRYVLGTEQWRLTFGDMFLASIGREASDP